MLPVTIRAMNFLKASALISVILVSIYIGLTWHSSKHAPTMTSGLNSQANQIQPSAPREINRTVSFMPGQYSTIPNREFRKVEIHSEYPIRVANGSCHLDYGVEFFCKSDASDIFITDMRPRPIFTAPKGNLVTVTLIEF